MAHGYSGANGAKVQGTNPSGTNDSGNPVKIGVFAITALPTAVTNGQDANVIGDKFGRQIMLLNSIRDLTSQNTVTLTNTTETTILSAAGANIFLDLTLLILTNSSATPVVVSIRDATGGSIVLPISLAANGGAVVPINTPWKQGIANNNWTAQLSTPVTSVVIAVQAVQNQ